MRVSLGDAQLDEGVHQAVAGQAVRHSKVDHAVVIGTGGQFVGVLLGRCLDKRALHGTHHGDVDAIGLRLDPRAKAMDFLGRHLAVREQGGIEAVRIAQQTGMDAAQSLRYCARLILLLANELGDDARLLELLALAAQPDLRQRS